MKKIFVITSLFFLISLSGQTTVFVGNQNDILSTGINPTLKAEVTHFPKESKFGFHAFALVGEHWAEGVIGVAYKPNSNIQLTTSIGIEQHENPFRILTTVFYQKNRFTTYTALEYGGSGFWYLNQNTIKMSDHIKLGTHAQRYLGIGPMIHLNHGNYGFFAGPTYDYEAKQLNATFGFTAWFF